MLARDERLEPFSVTGVVLLVTKHSFLLFDDKSGRELFIPHSQVLDWAFSDGGGGDVSTKVLVREDMITVEIPNWLAEKENLL